MDTAGVLAAIADASADIATIGTAIIGVAAVVFAFRWVKASFF